MNLDALTAASDAIAATRSRTQKVELLARCLRELAPDERETGVAWLSGVLHGGRLGLGPATVHALRDTPPAPTPTLSIGATSERLASLKSFAGKGAARGRQTALR